LFHENRRSLLSVLERRLQGITGTVRDMSGDRLSFVTISIWPIDGKNLQGKLANTTRNGHFHVALEAGMEMEIWKLIAHPSSD
jgi:hypothetical protein